MRPVRADYAPRSRPSRPLWLMLAFVVLAALGVVTVAWRANHELQATLAAIEHTKASRQASLPAAPRAIPAPPYDRDARQMLNEHTLPWPQVLAALEAIAFVGVTPTSVEIGVGEPVARVEVSFVDHARLLEYVDELNAGQTGSGQELNWSIVQAQAQGAGGSTAVLQATLLRWLGGAAPR